jgi:hypothetical protein
MDTSAPCSSWSPGGQQRIARSAGHVRHCGCVARICRAMSHSPRSFSPPPLVKKWTGARDPSGRARCGTRWNTSRALSRLPRSFGARAASISVLRDSLGASGCIALRLVAGEAFSINAEPGQGEKRFLADQSCSIYSLKPRATVGRRDSAQTAMEFVAPDAGRSACTGRTHVPFRMLMSSRDLGVRVMFQSSLRIATFFVLSVGIAATTAEAQTGGRQGGAAVHAAPAPRVAPAPAQHAPPQMSAPHVQMSAPHVQTSAPHVIFAPRIAPQQLARPSGSPLPSAVVRDMPTPRTLAAPQEPPQLGDNLPAAARRS